MDDLRLADRTQWADPAGRIWTRRGSGWLGEREAARILRRTSTLAAVEHWAGEHRAVEDPGSALSWLPLSRRTRFWDEYVLGHFDDDCGRFVQPNADGFVYRASVWTDHAAERLLLLSEIR
jgi:hypothetical protein